MKLSLRLLFLFALGCSFLLLPSCKNTTDVQLVDFTKADMYQLPQQVIDFYYNAEENPKKIFAVQDSSYIVDEKFNKISHFTETHYAIQINNQLLNIRERDFRAPFLIFNGKIYFSKSRILKGKLMTPQDLFIYYVDLKTVLK
jgi:hypothetical protein